MDTSSQTYLNKTIIKSPSPKHNSGKQPIMSDAGYEVKLDFQETVEKGGSVMGEEKLRNNMEECTIYRLYCQPCA